MTGLILLFAAPMKLVNSVKMSDLENIFSETSVFETFLDGFYVGWLCSDALEFSRR